MQLCPDTRDMLPPAHPPGEPGIPEAIRFDLGERAGFNEVHPVAENAEGGPARRRTPEQIQADLATQYKADLGRLNSRYANKLTCVVARVKPVAERRREALAKLDDMRAIVRRTNPILDEAGIDALIHRAIVRAYGDLADGAMPSATAASNTDRASEEGL